VLCVPIVCRFLSETFSLAQTRCFPAFRSLLAAYSAAHESKLFAWDIPLPSVEKQREIIGRLNEQMQAVEALKQSLTEKLAAVNKLPAALLRKAFAGEL